MSTNPGTSLRRQIAKLVFNISGIAATEFALAMPLLTIMTASGLELANFMLVKRRIGDITVQVSDNASRLGLESLLSTKQVREVDVNDVFVGAKLQAGKMDIAKHGRIIISSLETNATGGQWIHWQRCYGALNYGSSYGVEGDGATGNAFAGMGPAGAKATAMPGDAVIFVEMAYDYQPLVEFTPFKFGRLTEIASFNIRDNRDLTQIYNPAPAAVVATCS